MASKKTKGATKAPTKAASTGARIIDLDTLLDTPKTLRLGGREFVARECTMMERERYVRTEAELDSLAQRTLTAEMLNSRISDGGELVSVEWVGERTPSQLVQLVRILMNLQGDDEGNA